MILGVSGLTAAYILLAVLLLSVNLYSKWSWKIKALAIAMTSAFYLVSYFSFPYLLGWPTDEELPKHFRLLAAEVKQPDKELGEDGQIYLWLTQIENVDSQTLPRAYVVPYTGVLYERIINAKSKIKYGIPQLGEYNEARSPSNVKIDDASRSGKDSLDIQFYDLPDPLFPDK